MALLALVLEERRVLADANEFESARQLECLELLQHEENLGQARPVNTTTIKRQATV